MLQQVFNNPRLHVPVISAIGLLLFFPMLGARDFWEHENEYAEITRVMLLEGDYLLPKVNGELWADRPIFAFWIALAISRLAGQVNEWTVRLPSALAAMALILVYYHFLNKHFEARMAFLSTVVLASSLLTVHVERHLPANMVCFLLLVLSMFLFMEVLVFDSGRSLHVYGAWLTLGLACLTKGPLVTLCPAAVVCFYLALSRRWHNASVLRPLAGMVILLAVAVPWFAYAAWKTDGAWTHTFLTHQYFWRYTGHDSQAGGFSLAHAVNYLAFHLAAGFLPWTFLVVPATISLWPERFKLRQGTMLFFFIWALSILVISTFSDRHHGHDLFLILPPVALALGSYLDNLLSSHANDRTQVWTNRFILFGCLLLVVTGASGPFIAVSRFHWTDAPATGLHVIGAALVAMALGLFWAARKRSYYSQISGFAVLMIAANMLIHIFIFPAFNKLKARAFAERMGSLVESGSEVAMYRSSMSYKFNFYSRVKHFEELDRPGELQRWLSKDGAKYILARERFVQEINMATHNKVQLVLADSIGAQPWALLAWCKEKCGAVTSSEKLEGAISRPSQGSSRGQHGR